jgi:hypothetical protein
LPILEEFSKPWGWMCLAPYWFTEMRSRNDVKSYLGQIRASWRAGERIIPRLVKG